MNTAEIAIVLIIGSLTLSVFVLFLLLILIEYRRRQVRHITEKLELKHQYHHAVMQTQLEVQEQSFKYISEELHDNIAQTLSLARLKLYRTAGKATDNIFKAAIENSNELVGDAMDAIRNLSHVLNGGLISRLTLPESLEKELRYVREAKEMETELTITGTPYEIDEEKKLLAFRIIQEAVNNSIKHSKATRIDISVDYKPDGIAIKIADNGLGFDTARIKDSKGLGVHNIDLRAKMLGGVAITSNPDKGTLISLNIDTYEQ